MPLENTLPLLLHVPFLVFLVSCAHHPPAAHGPPAAAPEEPEIFGRGVVSTPAREFATSFTPDGRTVLFNRVDPEGRILLLEASWTGGGWSEPAPLPFSDGTFRDVDPFVTADGQLLFFTSDRAERGDVPADDFDIWVAERTAGGWAEPTRLPSPPNSSASEAFVSSTRDGTLYFGSTNTNDGARRILRSERVSGGYGPPEEVPLGLGDGESAGNPLILPDESALVFSSRDLGGAGEVDLFLSYRDREGSWSPPVPLPPPINSRFSDFAPGLGPGEGVLFFTSERPGIVPAGALEGRPPGDLYRVRLPGR